jgi:sulfur-oxidizing protein SoxY
MLIRCNAVLSYCFIAAAGALAILVLGVKSSRAGDDPWPTIQQAAFTGRIAIEDPSSVQIFAPNQADDAAIVPLTIKIAPQVVPVVKSLTLIIDRNPSPIAASFTFGDAYRQSTDIGERTLATRVRVDAFSRVRAVLETVDGKLHMASKFVIGSGGCSAPASKDSAEALAQLGRTQLTVKADSANGDAWREVRVMVRHPNYTGMQMNNKTGAYTPARFVDAIEVKQGNTLLWRMTGGISISEDPNIRFTFGTETKSDIEFIATDTTGARFTATGSVSPPS